jgi:hypothetical protein
MAAFSIYPRLSLVSMARSEPAIGVASWLP